MADTERGGVIGHALAGERGGDHVCPWCLTRVALAVTRRRPHREACHSGALDAWLLCCPHCGLALAAAVGPEAGPSGGPSR